MLDDVSDNEKNVQMNNVSSVEELWDTTDRTHEWDSEKSERFERAWRKVARHEAIPTFMPKSKDPDGNINVGKLPNKNKVLKEHLMSLEFPPMEDEVLDIIFILYHREVCDILDEQPTVLRSMVATNTTNLR